MHVFTDIIDLKVKLTPKMGEGQGVEKAPLSPQSHPPRPHFIHSLIICIYIYICIKRSYLKRM